MLAAFSSPWDHPRSCGAHPPAAINITGNSGSSPRMRGSHSATDCHSRYCGIIPAHAGLTDERPAQFARYRDHPRACGAHAIHRERPAQAAGSSPRMRGSRDIPQSSAASVGIIPAYAGLTHGAYSMLCQVRDHPRVCGAHRVRLTMHSTRKGSSPHMRGSLQPLAGRTELLGIIPAYAGLTSSTLLRTRNSGDHPRVCGAHSSPKFWPSPAPGSSPRMRGSPFVTPEPTPTEGIIPAYAGLTNGSSGRVCSSRDHPRVCGAHPFRLFCKFHEPGSSPRMRGSPDEHDGKVARIGIIPAYAGLTSWQCMGVA